MCREAISRPGHGLRTSGQKPVSTDEWEPILDYRLGLTAEGHPHRRGHHGRNPDQRGHRSQNPDRHGHCGWNPDLKGVSSPSKAASEAYSPSFP